MSKKAEVRHFLKRKMECLSKRESTVLLEVELNRDHEEMASGDGTSFHHVFLYVNLS